jgi:hypothetical protein
VKILDKAGRSEFNVGLLYIVKGASASRNAGNFACDLVATNFPRNTFYSAVI